MLIIDEREIDYFLIIRFKMVIITQVEMGYHNSNRKGATYGRSL